MTTVLANTVLPPGAAPITDTFDRADDAASLGVADSGQAWESLVGTWGISGNKAVLVSGTASVYHQTVVDSGFAAATVQVTLSPADISQIGFVGMAFRTQSAGNGLGLRLRPSVGQLALISLTGGVATTLAIVAFTVDTPPVVLRVECAGTRIRCFADGVLYIDEPAVTDYQAATKHGLLTLGVPAVAPSWNDFSIVESLPPPTITLQLSGNAQRVSTATIYTAYTTGNRQGLVEQVIDYHVGQRP